MDNSPCWDAPLSRVTPAPARSFRRADLDHGAAEDRPTDLDYGRYVRLAADYRDARICGRHRRVRRRGPLLQRAADRVGARAGPYRPGAGRDGDGPARPRGTPDGGPGGAAVGPGGGHVLLPRRKGHQSGTPQAGPDPRAQCLRARPAPPAHAPPGHRRHPRPYRARAALRGSAAPPGSYRRYDLLGEAFDPHRYWRGPAWFNTGWLVERGLRQHGEQGARRRAAHGAAGDRRHLRSSRSTWTRTPARPAGRSASAGPPRSPSTCSTNSPSATATSPNAFDRYDVSDMAASAP